jgi:hypothetical protein
MNDEMNAIYKDRDGNQFRYPVVHTPIGWKLSGTVDVLFYLREPTASGGLIQFVDYEICPAQRLRPADYIPYINSVRATLPWPQKPADPPQVNTQPTDVRLHLPDKIGTESSLQQLQRAYIEQEVVAQRKHRQAARAEMQKVSPPDPTKVEAARRVSGEYASLRNRHGLKNR